MAANIGDALRAGLLDRLDTTFPSGGTWKFYTGSRPAATTDAASGTLLVTITLPSSPWAAASGNSKAKQNAWEAVIGTSGTIGWARLANSGDTIRVDFTVTATGGGGDLTLPSLVAVAGKKLTISSMTVSV